MSGFGMFADKDSKDLFLEAFADLRTSVDKELDPGDIEALYFGNFTNDFFVQQSHWGAILTDALGLTPAPATRTEGACASSGLAFREACFAIASGFSLGAVKSAAKIFQPELTFLGDIVGRQVDTIASLTRDASALAATQPTTLKTRLQKQIADFLSETERLPEDRLLQEAALLATKADVREELDRLAAHVEAARQLLADDGAIGRRLDFLAQEFNREANTLCSKSHDAALTKIGIELKTVIDQFREQAQNIE